MGFMGVIMLNETLHWLVLLLGVYRFIFVYWAVRVLMGFNFSKMIFSKFYVIKVRLCEFALSFCLKYVSMIYTDALPLQETHLPTKTI